MVNLSIILHNIVIKKIYYRFITNIWIKVTDTVIKIHKNIHIVHIMTNSYNNYFQLRQQNLDIHKNIYYYSFNKYNNCMYFCNIIYKFNENSIHKI